MAIRLLGSELRIGDTIKVWWTPGRDTIVEFHPASAETNAIFLPEGARVAIFAINAAGMTIPNEQMHEVICRAAEPA